MKKSFYLLKKEFESSMFKTEQYLKFHKVFQREFCLFLLNNKCKEIQINKPNHFDFKGFFTTSNEKIFYFCITDLRNNKDMLIRTAKNYEDFVGGSNMFVETENVDIFIRQIKNIINN